MKSVTIVTCDMTGDFGGTLLYVIGGLLKYIYIYLFNFLYIIIYLFFSSLAQTPCMSHVTFVTLLVKTDNILYKTLGGTPDISQSKICFSKKFIVPLQSRSLSLACSHGA